MPIRLTSAQLKFVKIFIADYLLEKSACPPGTCGLCAAEFKCDNSNNVGFCRMLGISTYPELMSAVKILLSENNDQLTLEF